ncbi:MAG: SRPBCC family protein [Brevibacterium sp.]
MNRTMQVSDSMIINCDARTLWEQVADPTQMPRWSPENIGAHTSVETRPLQMGEVFEGTNRRSRARWITECVVTASEPGRRFAFQVRKIGAGSPKLSGAIATWDYEFEEVHGVTRVTETWSDDRTAWPDWVAAGIDRMLTGGRSFADFQRLNIHRTLTTMKDEFADAETTSPY